MNTELLQVLKDYIEFLVENASTASTIYPHLCPSDAVIQHGKDFRNGLRKFEELKDWKYLEKNKTFDRVDIE